MHVHIGAHGGAAAVTMRLARTFTGRGAERLVGSRVHDAGEQRMRGRQRIQTSSTCAQSRSLLPGAGQRQHSHARRARLSSLAGLWNTAKARWARVS